MNSNHQPEPAWRPFYLLMYFLTSTFEADWLRLFACFPHLKIGIIDRGAGGVKYIHGDIFLLTFSSAPSAPHSDMRCCLIMDTKPSVLTPERNSLVTTATWKIAFARKLANNVQLRQQCLMQMALPDVFWHPLFCCAPLPVFLGKENRTFCIINWASGKI